MRDSYFPQREQVLSQLRAELADEIGYPADAQRMDEEKHRIASELGLNQRIASLGWENMTSKECGAIGGRMGGKLGGSMVRRLIEIAERQLG